MFSRLPLPTVEDARAEYEADFDDPRFTTFVVERDGEVIGAAVGCPIEVSSSHKSVALPARRRRSSASRPCCRSTEARALDGCSARRSLAWARETGRRRVVTDWRMTNLLASRAWPRLGFRPTFYRLFRAIAERAAPRRRERGCRTV